MVGGSLDGAGAVGLQVRYFPRVGTWRSMVEELVYGRYVYPLYIYITWLIDHRLVHELRVWFMEPGGTTLTTHDMPRFDMLHMDQQDEKQNQEQSFKLCIPVMQHG